MILGISQVDSSLLMTWFWIVSMYFVRCIKFKMNLFLRHWSNILWVSNSSVLHLVCFFIYRIRSHCSWGLMIIFTLKDLLQMSSQRPINKIELGELICMNFSSSYELWYINVNTSLLLETKDYTRYIWDFVLNKASR